MDACVCTAPTCIHSTYKELHLQGVAARLADADKLDALGTQEVQGLLQCAVRVGGASDAVRLNEITCSSQQPQEQHTVRAAGCCILACELTTSVDTLFHRAWLIRTAV